MRLTSLHTGLHRKGPVPTGVDAYHAGRGALEVCMLGYQKTDGLYWVKAVANSNASQAYCDMTTDGGGWMLIARTDPRTTAGNVAWGWLAAATGAAVDFTQAYSFGWVNWHNVGGKFNQYIYGNRKNIGNNQWGPFIYKRSFSTGYDSFMTTNTEFSPAPYVIKSDTSIYNYTGYPSMQILQGHVPDISFNSYYMRDVPGNGNLSYGLHSDGMGTTYINNTDPGVNGGNGWQLSGPWWTNTYNSTTGDFDQASGDTHYGGTNQVMLMVRNLANAP